MGRINQREQDIDVEPEGHGSSSRNALMISSVTGGPSGLGDRRGTPLRSPPLAPWLAQRPSRQLGNYLADASVLLSRHRLRRDLSCINHHASYGAGCRNSQRCEANRIINRTELRAQRTTTRLTSGGPGFATDSSSSTSCFNSPLPVIPSTTPCWFGPGPVVNRARPHVVVGKCPRQRRLERKLGWLKRCSAVFYLLGCNS